MLVLTRRIGETLIIDLNNGKPPIAIKVLKVQGNQARLGIDAQKEIAVHREEIYQRIQQEKTK